MHRRQEPPRFPHVSLIAESAIPTRPLDTPQPGPCGTSRMAKRISLSSHRLPGAMPVPCPKPPTSPSLLTLRDVRRIVRGRLGRQPDPSTIFRWCQSERLPSVRVAGHIYVQAADLDSFLEAQPVSRSGRDAEQRRRGWVRVCAACRSVQRHHGHRLAGAQHGVSRCAALHRARSCSRTAPWRGQPRHASSDR